MSWSTQSLTYGFLADGAAAEGVTSTLFATLNATAPTAAWQREVARALQTWADATNLNFHPAAGSANIRLGAVPQGGSLGYSYYPPDGGVYLNPAYRVPDGADQTCYSSSCTIRHSRAPFTRTWPAVVRPRRTPGSGPG